jgi:4a-hydroxytetrahydrobiopterin dehydratase
MTALSHTDIAAALQHLPGWQHTDDALVKEYRARSFEDAVAFVVRLSYAAARLDHHPELFNVYATLRVRLTTHDAGNRVTQNDLDLAREIEALSPAFC